MIQGHPFTFKIPASGTGSQSVIANIPFRPKCFIFKTVGNITNEVFRTPRYTGAGVAEDPSIRGFTPPGSLGNFYQGSFGTNSVNPFSGFGGYRSDYSCIGINGFGGYSIASLVSVDDLGGGLFGITLNWTKFVGGAGQEFIIIAMALGGDFDVRQLGWSPGTTSGLPWCPDCVVSVVGATAPSENPLSIYPGYVFGFSAFNAALEQCSVLVIPSNGLGQAVGVRAHSINKAALMMGAEGAGFRTFEVTAMTSDGWTGTLSAGSATVACYGLAFKYVASKIGSFVKPVSTLGPQNISTVGVDPAVAILFGDNNLALTTPQNNDRIALGFASAVGGMGGASSSVRQEVSTAAPFSGVIDTARTYLVVNNDDELVTARINSVAFAPDVVTPNWETNDTQETEILLAALGTGVYATCEQDVTIPIDEESVPTVVYDVPLPEIELEDLPVIEENPIGGTPEISPPIQVRPDGKPVLSPTPTQRRVLPTQG